MTSSPASGGEPTPQCAGAAPAVPDKARIRWLCRRGMKELDVLLERYLAQHFDTASPAQRLAFVQLLDREDPELWAWLVGQAPAPADYADVVERIQQYA